MEKESEKGEGKGKNRPQAPPPTENRPQAPPPTENRPQAPPPTQILPPASQNLLQPPPPTDISPLPGRSGWAPTAYREDGIFTTRLHYSGQMVESNGKHYVSGKVQLIDNCDSDKWSKLEVDDILEKLNFDVSRLEYYYLKPGMSLDGGLMRLFDNLSSVEMAEIGVQKGVVDVFVVEANDLVVSQITQENIVEGVGGDSGDGVMGLEGMFSEGVGGEFGDGAMRSKGYEFGDEDDNADFEDCEFGKGEGIEEATACKKGKAFENAIGKGKGKDDLAEGPSFIDSDYDLSDHEEDAIMTLQVEGWKKVVEEMGNDHMGDTSDSDHLPSESPSSASEEEMEHDGNNDKLVSRRYRAATDLNDPRWELGIRFNCKEDFADLIRHQGVLLGKRLRLEKNDSIRCLAKCKGVIRSKKKHACPWFVQIAYRGAALGFWQISRLRNQHKCGGASFNHGCANSRYLSKKYKEDIRVFPGMSVGQFIEKVHSDKKITISSSKAKRAMQAARKLIEVDLVRQYKRLHDYKAEILRSNPGSTVMLSTHRLSDGTDKFKAIYIAYAACKTSFKRYCRRLVGLDGCHLRGLGNGILLTAVGLDPNDQIFPIAHAVVRIENTETWTWFLGLLVMDLEITDSSIWTFISDKQKGLIAAMRSCVEHAEHRMCVWHMHNNFKKQFPSAKLKDKIWEAARATNTYGFDKAILEIKNLNQGAYKWLMEHTRKENWSRAFFGFDAKCDILVNNICECYNKVLLFAREKPLYAMLECIRMYLMDRFTTRRKMGERVEDAFGPKIRKKLEKAKAKIGECMVREAGEWIYQVNTAGDEQFVVDLRKRSCSCRRWMLTGLPCPHAIAAIGMTTENVDNFVSRIYSKETFQQVYAPIIYPVQGPQLWTRTAQPDVVPPELTKLPGRPKGARKKTVQEAREINKKKSRAARIVQVREDSEGCMTMSRKGLMSDYKCRLCGVIGHNKRSCPTREPVAGCSGPKPTTGKKRKQSEEQQKCALCRQPGHNRTRCPSAIADMFADPASSSVVGDNLASASTLKKT